MYADDTYIIYNPSQHSYIRTTELKHIHSWAKQIVDKRVCKKSKRTATPPPPLSGIARRSALKTLGVIITNGLSMAEHIQGVITSCSQSLHALRILRSYGMPLRLFMKVSEQW